MLKLMIWGIRREVVVFPKYEGNAEEVIARVMENVKEEKLDGGYGLTPGLPL